MTGSALTFADPSMVHRLVEELAGRAGLKAVHLTLEAQWHEAAPQPDVIGFGPAPADESLVIECRLLKDRLLPPRTIIVAAEEALGPGWSVNVVKCGMETTEPYKADSAVWALTLTATSDANTRQPPPARSMPLSPANESVARGL